jgi:hypothetical protein
MEKKYFFLLGLILIFILILGTIFFYWDKIVIWRQSEEIAEEEFVSKESFDLKSNKERYIKFEVNGIGQISGLVYARDDKNRELTLEYADGRLIKTKVKEGASFSKPVWDEMDNTEIVSGDFWTELIPQETEITAVCSDENNPFPLFLTYSACSCNSRFTACCASWT